MKKDYAALKALAAGVVFDALLLIYVWFTCARHYSHGMSAAGNALYLAGMIVCYSLWLALYTISAGYAVGFLIAYLRLKRDGVFHAANVAVGVAFIGSALWLIFLFAQLDLSNYRITLILALKSLLFIMLFCMGAFLHYIPAELGVRIAERLRANGRVDHIRRYSAFFALIVIVAAPIQGELVKRSIQSSEPEYSVLEKRFNESLFSNFPKYNWKINCAISPLPSVATVQAEVNGGSLIVDQLPGIGSGLSVYSAAITGDDKPESVKPRLLQMGISPQVVSSLQAEKHNSGTTYRANFDGLLVMITVFERG